MKKNFGVTVNDKKMIEIDSDQLLEFDLAQEGEYSYHLLKNKQSLKIKLLESDFQNRTYHFELNGVRYKIHIKNELEMLIDKMGFIGSNSITKNAIIAPMPGIINKISVQEGDIVKEGDTLCVLEAMKMENSMTSPKDAVIKIISIAVGDAVEKGKLLIVLE